MEIDITSKCRVCLSDNKQLHYLYNEFDQGITLKEILTTTTGFQVEENDGLSPYVCESCTSILVDFYNLKTIYEQNEKQIKALMDKNNVDNKEENDDDEEEEDCITIKVETYDSDNGESADDVKGENNESLEEGYEYQEINTYTCPECGECFLYQTDIQNHLASKHDITKVDYDEISEVSYLKVRKENQIDSPNKCKICSQSFSSEKDYKEHLETHKKNVCDICGVGFIKKSYLKDHQEIHCTEKRHVCNYCNKAFKRRTVLAKHRKIHTHPRQCICEICGKAFNDKGTLKTHIMLLHTRERNYMCLICGVKFPLKGTLEKHIRRHQNKEREFFCTQCPLGYRDKSSLDRHIFVKHSGQNIKSTCRDCGKQYTTMSNLFKHMRNCHKIRIDSENIS